jgi:hypothetical protein
VTLERDAIVKLSEKGWIKGVSRSSKGVCLMGAVFDALEQRGVSVWIDEIAPNLTKVIEEQFPDRLPGIGYESAHPVPYFNDHPDTVIEDVVLVLEKSANLSEELI